MHTLTASTLETLRTHATVKMFNATFTQAHKQDCMIEEAMRGPECIDADDVVKMHANGKRLNARLNRLAKEVQYDFLAAGIQVESEWGARGDWAIFLKPHLTFCRTEEFLITSPITFHG